MSTPTRSDFALRFGILILLLMGTAGGIAALSLHWLPPTPQKSSTQFSVMFALSTLLLILGSVALHRALISVRRERQRSFRQNLTWALVFGTMFVSSQTYALICLIKQQRPEEVETGAGAYVAVAATLHAVHFVIALMCLTFISVRAFADRYDHEYYWGVTVCTWFWHVLGIIWGIIVFVMIIVSVGWD